MRNLQKNRNRADILDENNAVNVNEKADQYGYNQTEGTSSTYNTAASTTSATSNYDINSNTENREKSIPVIEETLKWVREQCKPVVCV